MTITCFGELLFRLSPPGAQLMIQADSLSLDVGGAEANVAAALASLGHAVRFAGLVSDNDLGTRAVRELRAAAPRLPSARRACAVLALAAVQAVAVGVLALA